MDFTTWFRPSGEEDEEEVDDDDKEDDEEDDEDDPFTIQQPLNSKAISNLQARHCPHASDPLYVISGADDDEDDDDN